MMESLLKRLPDGPKKDALLQKFAQLQKLKSGRKGKGATGLEDKFQFEPKGHIKIEAINNEGEVTGVLVDRDNLVVNGSEEIAIKALAGNPNQTLYRNRTIKPDAVGAINDVLVYIEEKKLNDIPLHDVKGILHAPNVFWAAVDEKDFITDYAYYPNTVFIKEEASLEPGKRAFSISHTASSNRVPLVAETYSGYTNMFIGLGDGKQTSILLDDPRFVVTGDAGAKKSPTEISTKKLNTVVEFKDKITRFAVTLEKSNKGGQVQIAVNGTVKDTVDTYDSNLTEPESFVYEQIDLEDGAASTITLTMTGNDEAVTDPVMKITRFECDALDKSMNSLMAEFKNFETKFLTPTAYNTDTVAPYEIQLPHRDIIDETLIVTYDGKVFEHVTDAADLAEGKVLVNKVKGTLEFDRALSNVQAAYEITGKVFDEELIATMPAGANAVETVVTNTPVSNVSVIGTPDDELKEFKLSHQNIVKDTLIVTVDGTALTAEEIESIDTVEGKFVLVTAPTIGQVIKASYERPVTSTVSHTTRIYNLAHEAQVEGLHLEAEDGVAFEYVETLNEVLSGKFTIDPTNAKKLIVSAKKADGEPVQRVLCLYKSEEVLGIDTNYRRAVIEKPKVGNEHPWFNLDKGTIQFVAEFPEDRIKQNVTIREMGLFDGPRVDDHITGFYGQPVNAFSLVRTGETLKDANTGLRITWTIKLTNEKNEAFTGGNN